MSITWTFYFYLWLFLYDDWNYLFNCSSISFKDFLEFILDGLVLVIWLNVTIILCKNFIQIVLNFSGNWFHLQIILEYASLPGLLLLSRICRLFCLYFYHLAHVIVYWLIKRRFDVSYISFLSHSSNFCFQLTFRNMSGFNWGSLKNNSVVRIVLDK